MPEFNEVKIKRILNPTSINLGEYVINPFMGCEHSCIYCYVRSNRITIKKNKPWGQYVDIRVNAPELLEKELVSRKPRIVLLGSTTECFQPIERKYRITRRILEILNRHKVYYVILTRSPYILDYIYLLKNGFCQKIYFTINRFKSEFKLKLEPKSPDFDARDETVNILLNEGIPVVPYFSPVIPWVSDMEGVFYRFKKAKLIEFECLNFRLSNINDIIDSASAIDYSLKSKYKRMLSNKQFYIRVWRHLKINLDRQARSAGKNYYVYIHEFGDYFKNTYS